MSLNPHWFSTIFGVYFFAGCMLSGLAAMVLLAAVAAETGVDRVGGECTSIITIWGS